MGFRLPGIIRHDPLRKLVAVFFALLVWGVVRRQLSDQQTKDLEGIPVRIAYDTSKVWVQEGPLPLVRLTVRAGRGRLEETTAEDFHIEVRIPDSVAEGQQVYEINLSSRHLRRKPLLVQVVRFSPSSVIVPVDRITSRVVRVETFTRGELREGYRVVQVRALPPEVLVTGPARVVRDLGSVQAEPVELTETAVMSYEEQRDLRRLPEVIMPPSVRVEVVIERMVPVSRVWRDLPLAVLTLSGGGLNPDGPLPGITVTLRGPAAAVETLTAPLIRPFVDLSDVSEAGRHRRQVKVWLDGVPGVTCDPPEPAWVDLSLISGVAPPPATAKEEAGPAAPGPAEPAP